MEFIDLALSYGVETTIGKIVMTAGVVVLAAKAITTWTPTTADDAVLNKVLGVLNTLALNIGKDKNAE